MESYSTLYGTQTTSRRCKYLNAIDADEQNSANLRSYISGWYTSIRSKLPLVPN
jgi:hypothetical protein